MAGIYFLFLKSILGQNWKVFNTKIGPQWKYQESAYQVRQILAQISCSNFRLKLLKTWEFVSQPKIVKKIISEGVWGELEAINCFQRQSFTKCFRQTLVFMWNSTLWEKLNFCFLEDFH